MGSMLFQMPEKVETKDVTKREGTFILSPLERGFAITIGNAMRRVLLSSLHGSAITQVKLGDALHEFTTIPGVKEDVTHIILNLKKVRIKMASKKPVRVNFRVEKAMTLTAADLGAASSEIEVMNPEQPILTANEEANFDVEIRVGRGRGYVPAEENRSMEMPVGTIPVDSIFSPVENVAFEVENTRVGGIVDYEKLILKIATDGSITPEEALNYAANILMDHLKLFVHFEIETPVEEEDEVDTETLRLKNLLNTSVEELELSVRSYNCLKMANIKTIGDLITRDENEMLKFRNFGRKSLTELGEILAEKGLSFGMEIPKEIRVKQQ